MFLTHFGMFLGFIVDFECFSLESRFLYISPMACSLDSKCFCDLLREAQRSD